MPDLSTIAMIALMGGAVYFLMIRPQQKKAKETAKLMSSLEPGSRVMTISGIVGTIKYLGDKQAILEVSPGVEITMDKRALSTQPVVDEFEYAEDGEAELITGETVTNEIAATEVAEPEVAEPEVAEPAEAPASDEPTDGPTWDAPPAARN